VIYFNNGHFVKHVPWNEEAKTILVVNKESSDSRVKLIIDEGRRFLLRTNEKCDLILIDPIRTTTSYSNNLYSNQCFQIINQHLTPGGAFLGMAE